MHQATALAATEQLHMQSQPDMAAFEADFQAPTPEHIHTIDCGHHHAEGVHVDYPEDQGAAAVHGHETEHGEHEHVHGKGCGHIEYQDISEQIDTTHKHDEHCGHLPPGDAKTRIDKPHEKHEAHHTEVEHRHEHHAGCGHVGHEKAEASVDKPHVHDEHCGHVDHAKSEAHVDRSDCASGACGHEHHHSKQVDDAIDQEGARHPDQIAKTDTHTRKQIEVDRHHEHEAVAHSNNEAEQTSPPQVVREAEKAYRQQLIDAQEQIIRHEEESYVASEMKATLTIDQIDREQAHIEHAQEYTKTAETEAVSQVIPYVAAESVTPIAEDESTNRVQLVEIEDVPIDAENQSSTVELSEQHQLVEPVEMETDQPLEATAESVPELSLPDIAEAPALVLETQPDTISELDEVVDFTPLESLGIEPVALAVFEPVITTEAQPQPFVAVAEDSSVGQPERSTVIAPSVEGALETLTMAVVERYDEIEGQLASVAPEQLQEIQKVLACIRSNLQPSKEHRVMPEILQSQLIQLLQMLGFEHPSQALTSYIQQYGISFVDELLARFFELLGQGRSFESLHVLQPQITDDDQDASVVMKLGGIVLLFARMGGQFV